MTMPDREKVIKGLECEEYSEYARCNQCPYVQFHKCKTLLMRDALALLKEPQKKPQQIEMEGGGNNDDVLITVDGKNAGVLIGHHGETMDALQYLANLAANKKVNGEKREYAKITLDIEGYRAKREAALRSMARKKASAVLKYKKSVMLEPMNPYERRIVHSEVQKIEGVSTNSIGSENNRRVVLFLDDSKTPAEAED